MSILMGRLYGLFLTNKKENMNPHKVIVLVLVTSLISCTSVNNSPKENVTVAMKEEAIDDQFGSGTKDISNTIAQNLGGGYIGHEINW